MNTSKPPERFDAGNTPDEVHRQAAILLGDSDATAGSRLQSLAQLHQARLTLLARTATALKVQLGGSVEQVKAADAAVTVSQTSAARVALASRRVNTPAPAVDPAGWALQGRVSDAKLQPVSGYSVFLVDAQKTYQSAYGFAYTDATGYFLLNFAGPPTTTQAPGTNQAAGVNETTAQLYLQVFDLKREPVYLSTEPFAPAPGTTTYQDITLPPGNEPLGNPPDQVLKVASPAAEKKP